MTYPHTHWTRLLQLAKDASTCGEIPVAAMVVKAGTVISEAVNRTERDTDPTAHAELLALRRAAKILGTPRLTSADLLVTLEPCPMCAQAISFARIHTLYYGAYDIKGGGVDHGARIYEQSSCHHTPNIVSGIEEKASATLLRDFFANKR